MSRYRPSISILQAFRSCSPLYVPPIPFFNHPALTEQGLQSGLKLENNTSSLTANNTPFIVDYYGPGPPPFSAPHRYVFLLYEQPADFDVAKFAPKDGKKVGIWPRVHYDLRKFEEKAGLGGVVAVNYFSSN
jgi:hypothetical protein